MIEFRFDSIEQFNSSLQVKKIMETDLPLINELGLKDWNDHPFNSDALLKYGRWTVNEDKSVIFKALGGGAFEIPEMYDLFLDGIRVRLECGGGGTPARISASRTDGRHEVTVSVNKTYIPSGLAHLESEILATAAQCFAVPSSGSLPAVTTVRFAKVLLG